MSKIPFTKLNKKKSNAQIMKELLEKYDPEDTLQFQDESILKNIGNPLVYYRICFSHSFIELIATQFVENDNTNLDKLNKRLKRTMVRKTMRWILQTMVLQLNPASYLERFLTLPKNNNIIVPKKSI